MGHKYIVILLLLVFALTGESLAQQPDSTAVKDFTQEEIQQLTRDQLLDLSLEELMTLVKKLKLSSIEELYQMVLNPVVKSASKKEEQSFKSPLSVSVITKEEIRQSGALNIPEALRLSPDLIVRQKTNGNYDVHIRGNDNVPPGEYLFDSENTISLVMIDGRPVYNHFQGGTFWEALPITVDDIQKIEVVAGPATALYGPNAVTGVINILTSRPQTDDFRVHSDFQYGNANSQKAYLSLEKGYERFSTRISANYQHRDRFQDDYLNFIDYEYYPSDSLPSIINNADERYPEPMLALDNQGINLNTRYDNNKNLMLDLSVGAQKSSIQTIYLDINNLSLSRRESEMQYFNFRGNWHGLKATVSYDHGLQDNAVGFYGYKYDIGNLNSALEYDLNLGIFTFSPGISYTESVFDDTPYLNQQGDKSGLFNQRVVLSNTAYFIRSELNPTEKIRFIAAVRLDDYNLPEKNYWTYQFVSSFMVDEKSHLRLVYSRANRGPFMYDYHVDHRSEYVNNDGFTEVERFIPNVDLQLVVMDMLEFGFRHRLRENIMTDFSFFYHKAHDFSNNVTTVDTVGQSINYLSTIKNSDLISRQLGATVRFNYVMNKKFSMKLFATGQLTVLENLNLDYALGSGENQSLITINSDFIHKSTPSMYGGLILNYAPSDRWNFNTNFYRYGRQNFFSIDGITKIESKTIMNLKTSYRFYKDNHIYFNARNFLDNSSYEFPFADKARGLYMIGLNLNF